MARPKSQQSRWASSARFALSYALNEAQLLKAGDRAGNGWGAKTGETSEISFRARIVVAQQMQQTSCVGQTKV
ncbi:MAG: hypothetical protein ACRD3K_07265 [Edaphobacter sp.]